MLWEKYYIPATIEETIKLLNKKPGKARIIAGGTDLLLQLKRKELKILTLIDITNINNLHYIKTENGVIKIGALVTHMEAAYSELLSLKVRALVQAASQVGSPQIRNQGTIVGNIINAQPAADTAIALLALNASVKVVSENGERILPIEKIFFDIGKSRIDPTRELVVGLELLAAKRGQTSVFVRFSKRKALTLPIINMALLLGINHKKTYFQDVRIAIGPVASTPFRAKRSEEILRKETINDDIIREAAAVAADEANPRDSRFRGSCAYRKEIVKVLLRRAIREALVQLGVNQV